ncbi:hypothetical protein B0H21DRAFT_500229 [Amylocystis lapponica]|nr:hypothetical protein B0H21DRAFT_500229 [Amylocystis lapponica]
MKPFSSRLCYIGVASNFTLFVLCTVHLGAVLGGLQIAFFESPSSDAFFSDRTQFHDVIQKVSYTLATVVSDGLMIHRLYIIFAGSWKAITLPCMSLLATSVVWCTLVNAWIHSPPGTTIYAHTVIRLEPTALSLSFFTNVVITVMIIVRIVRTMRSVREFAVTQSVNWRFLAYTIESGLIYPLSLLALGVLFLVKSNGLEILSGSNIQLLCLVPLLLTLQTRLKLSIYDAAIYLYSHSGSTAALDSNSSSREREARRCSLHPPRIPPIAFALSTYPSHCVSSWPFPDVDLPQDGVRDGIAQCSAPWDITAEQEVGVQDSLV